MTSPFTTPFGCSPLGVTTSKARTGIRLETFKQPNQAAPLHTSALTSVCEPATTHTMAAPSPQQPFGAQASAAVGGPRTTSAPPTQVAGSPVPGMQPGMTVPAPGTPGYGMPFMGTAPYYPAMTPGMMMPGMPRGGAPQFIPAQAVVKPAGGTPQSQRKRRVAAIEDDSGTVLNKSEIEAAAKEAAAKEAAAKEAAAKPPAPIAVAPPRKPGSGAVITDVTPAPAGDAGTPVVAPTPSPVPAGGATPTSPPAATTAPKEVAPASPAPVSTPVPVLSPMESLAAEKASHPVWVPPVSIVYGVGLEVSESKPADLVKYTRDQLKRLAPETGPRQSKAAWYSGLPAFKVLNKPEGNALSSYGGSRRRAGDAGGRRTGGSRRGGAPASAAGAEGKSGKDFAALRDPTVLLHSAGEGSYTRQMSREKSHAEQIKEEVTSILNKLARDTFDKLSGQILALEITTMEELLAVVSVVYDKAVEFQKFQDLFADLCHKLTRSSAVWILTPEGSHTFGVTFKGSDGKYWCNLTGDKSTDAGQVKDGKATRQYVYGPKATEAEASTDMQRQCSFMRILLNRAQQEFSAEVSYADLEEAEAKDKVDEEAHKAAGTLTDKLADAFQGRKEERQLQGIIRKRKVLSNISFIGELYKVNIAKAMIIDYCIMKLLAGGEDLSPQVVDETDALAFCNLMAVVGSKLESEEGDLPADAPPARGRKLRVHQMMDFLQRLYSEKKHGSIVRFRALDVKEAAERGWTFKDGHVAKTTKTMTKEEFYKAEKEKEMAKKVAALKKKQALSRHGGGGGRDYGGRSGRGGRFDANQDVRVASDATGPSRHAGGGGRRRPGGRPGGPKMSMSSRGGAAAAPAAAAGAGSAASANILEGDALDLRVGSLFIDWGSNLRPQDREDATVETLAACPAGKEIVTSLDEIKASPALGSVLISKGVKVLKDAKEDKERSDAALLLSLAWSKGAIKEVDVTKGLAATLGNYKDTKAYDLPKVDVYLGTLLAPLVSAGHLTPAFLVNLFGSGTAFLAGSGLALLAVVLSTAGVVLPADISLLSLCGPSGFDVRGFAKNVAAAQASTALTAHPDMVTVAALLKWRQDTDRKEAADAVAAWDAGLASAPAAAAASALLQIVADAGSMGMGGDGGAADVAELTKFDAALTHIAGAGKAAGAADFVAFLAEGLGRWALVEEMYKADTRGPAAAALLGHFVKLGLVSAPELKTWKSTKAGPLVSASHAVIARFYKALL